MCVMHLWSFMIIYIYIYVILCNDVDLHAFMIIYACEQHDVHHHHRHHNNNKKTNSACWSLCNNTTFPRTSSADEFPTAVPAVFTIPRPSNLKTFPLFGFVTIYGYCNGENPTNHFPFSKYTISKSKSILQIHFPNPNIMVMINHWIWGISHFQTNSSLECWCTCWNCSTLTTKVPKNWVQSNHQNRWKYTNKHGLYRYTEWPKGLSTRHLKIGNLSQSFVQSSSRHQSNWRNQIASLHASKSHSAITLGLGLFLWDFMGIWDRD